MATHRLWIRGFLGMAAALVTSLSPLPSFARNLDVFFEQLISRGVPVSTQSTLTWRPRGGSGAPKGIGAVRYPTARGFGQASIRFDDSDAIIQLQDGVLGQSPDFPIGSSVAAFAFTFDPARNVFDRSTEAMGPLLSERAETTGKGKLNVALSFAYLDFDVFEGEDLDDLDIDLASTTPFRDPNAQYAVGSSSTPANVGGWTLNTGSALRGQTAPGTTSSRAFVNDCGGFAAAPCSGFGGKTGFGGALGDGVYTLDVESPTPRATLDARVRTKVSTLFVNYGITDRIDVGVVIPYLDVRLDGEVTTFFPDGSSLRTEDSDDASGLGDIIIRGKARFLETELVDMAARLDLYLPTGNEDDLRGFGDPAVGLLIAGSKTYGRISPHANVGVLIRGGGKQQHEWRFSGGLDIRVTERLSFTTDAIFADALHNDGVGDFRASLATGVKVNPWRRLVLSANVLWRLNSRGLRADWVPAFSAEYTF